MRPLALVAPLKAGVLGPTDPLAAVCPVVQLATGLASTVRPVASLLSMTASSVPLQAERLVTRHIPASLVPRTANEKPAIRQEVLLGALVALSEAIGLDVDVTTPVWFLVPAVPETQVLTADESLTATSAVAKDVVVKMGLVLPVQLLSTVSPEALEATARLTAKAMITTSPAVQPLLTATATGLGVTPDVATAMTTRTAYTPTSFTGMGASPLKVAATGTVLAASKVAKTTWIPRAIKLEVRLLTAAARAVALIVQAEAGPIPAAARPRRRPVGARIPRPRLIGLAGLDGLGLTLQGSQGLVVLVALTVVR